MSIKIMNLVWDSDLSRDKKYICVALADWANDDGGNIYPAIKRIAWKTGYSETQVRAIINSLVGEGIITRQGISKLNTNLLQIEIDALPERPPYRSPLMGRPKKVASVSDTTFLEDEKSRRFSEKVASVFAKVASVSEPDPLLRSVINPSEEDSWQKFLFDFVNRIRPFQEEQVIREQYDRYFSRTWLETEEEGRWVIACPDETTLEWMRQRLQRTMERDLVGYFGRPVSLEFILAEQPELVVEAA